MFICVVEGVSKWMFIVKEFFIFFCDYIIIIGGGVAFIDIGNIVYIVGGTVIVRWK